MGTGFHLLEVCLGGSEQFGGDELIGNDDDRGFFDNFFSLFRSFSCDYRRDVVGNRMEKAPLGSSRAAHFYLWLLWCTDAGGTAGPENLLPLVWG